MLSINVECQTSGRFSEPRNELIKDYFLQCKRRMNADYIRESREHGLTGQIMPAVGRTVGTPLEHRVIAKDVVTVLDFIVRQNADNSQTRHFREGMLCKY